MNAIVATNLSKRYGEATAVDCLNLVIQQGELFSLLGLNGAGKTTTIKMLSCLSKPTGGDALLLGDSINEKPQSIKKIINLSPQETAIAPNLTVKENLELVAGLYGQKKETAQKSALEIAARFGLGEIMAKKSKILSGGMQRRLSIAMALISNPQILFLDEPTLGLDILARRELWAAIRELKGKITIVLTTHYLEEAENLSDRVGMMVKGKLMAVGTVAELTIQTQTTKLEDAFVVLTGGKV